MEKWWKRKVIYQIYPRSFCDSNGDGIGDIRGIISKLDYLKDLGVGALWLSPVYKSPNDDYGYDISDYKSINPEFGTLEDMDELIAQAKARDIRIIMDLVINHTSDEHGWFIKSRNREPGYEDYYIWRDGKGRKADGTFKRAPNNWSSFFTGSAWAFDETRGQYYLHLFSQKQPDLNYNNPAVYNEIKSVLEFWLERGVSGFRCDVINVIYKTSLANGKRHIALTGKEHYLSQEGCHKILNRLNEEVLSKYDAYTVGETVMVGLEEAKKLTAEERKELDTVFSFAHMETDQINNQWFKTKFKPDKFYNVLSKWQRELPWNTVYLENHDQPRSVSRFGDDKNYRMRSSAALMGLTLTLRGTPFIFEGQEIGMTNMPFTSLNQIKDISTHNVYAIAKKLHFPKKIIWKLVLASTRDNARTPMQWNDKKGAGFTTGEPWLMINPNYRIINVEKDLKSPGSVIVFTKKLIAFRDAHPDFVDAPFERIPSAKGVFCYRRGGFTVVVNLTAKKSKFRVPNGTIVLSNFARSAPGAVEPYEFTIVADK